MTKPQRLNEMTKPQKYDGGGCKCLDMGTLKLLLRSASVFLSQRPRAREKSDIEKSNLRLRRWRRSLSSPSPTSPAHIVPIEARRRRKSRRSWPSCDFQHEDSSQLSSSDDEPKSPRVSCVGRIEMKRNQKKKKNDKDERKKTNSYSSYYYSRSKSTTGWRRV